MLFLREIIKKPQILTKADNKYGVRQGINH